MAVSSAMKARPFSVAADARQFVKRFMSSEITDASCLFVCLFGRIQGQPRKFSSIHLFGIVLESIWQ